VWNIEQPAGGADSNDTLNSVGAGVRMNVLEAVSVNLEVAHRLGASQNNIENLGLRETRGFFSIIARF
jgi:hypothetical protein